MKIKTKNKDVEHILNRLIQYPVVKAPPKQALALSRNKGIRELSRNDSIFIRGGVISLPHKVQLQKGKNGFDVIFR